MMRHFNCGGKVSGGSFVNGREEYAIVGVVSVI